MGLVEDLRERTVIRFTNLNTYDQVGCAPAVWPALGKALLEHLWRHDEDVLGEGRERPNADLLELRSLDDLGKAPETFGPAVHGLLVDLGEPADCLPLVELQAPLAMRRCGCNNDDLPEPAVPLHEETRLPK